MTPRELISKYKQHNPDGHFFDRDNLKFFGESISDMRIEGTEEIKDYHGEIHTCYVLSTLQKNHPCGATRMKHYFDTETFKFITA